VAELKNTSIGTCLFDLFCSLVLCSFWGWLLAGSILRANWPRQASPSLAAICLSSFPSSSVYYCDSTARFLRVYVELCQLTCSFAVSAGWSRSKFIHICVVVASFFELAQQFSFALLAYSVSSFHNYFVVSSAIHALVGLAFSSQLG
jgi:hypothetical protein